MAGPDGWMGEFMSFAFYFLYCRFLLSDFTLLYSAMVML